MIKYRPHEADQLRIHILTPFLKERKKYVDLPIGKKLFHLAGMFFGCPPIQRHVELAVKLLCDLENSHIIRQVDVAHLLMRLSNKLLYRIPAFLRLHRRNIGRCSIEQRKQSFPNSIKIGPLPLLTRKLNISKQRHTIKYVSKGINIHTQRQ
ncbi:hypothetical protein D3C81_1452310 [compost metagenome]